MDDKTSDALVELLGTVARLFVGTLIGMLLWNSLAVNHFGMPNFNYWQMMGLFILAGLLFKSWSPWRLVKIKKD